MRHLRRTASLWLLFAAASWAGEVSPEAIAGTWRSGQGPVSISIRLHADGTYVADWVGCLGRYGQAGGHWTLNGGTVELAATQETDMLRGFFQRLEVEATAGELRLYRLVPGDRGPWEREDRIPFERIVIESALAGS